jgi:hypothetical protein
MVIACVLACACNKSDPVERARDHGQPTPEAPGDPEPSSTDASPGAANWRFRETLDKSLPAGTTVEPIIEAAMPDAGQVRIVAATHRAEADLHLSIEVWTFDQSGPDGTLVLAGEPRPILRLLDEGGTPDELKTLRRELAAPGTTVVRPVGIAAPDAGALVRELADAARVVLDEDAEARARVDAVATLVRGVDDAIVLERDGLGDVIETLAAGAVEVSDEAQASTRRRSASVTIGGRTWDVAMIKKGGGWVVSQLAAG